MKSKQLKLAFDSAISTTPKINVISGLAPTGDFSRISAVWYDGMSCGGKKTKVFAYIGFPESASATNKVPAIVLVHGGGGHAFLPWVKMWNDRGYAAIAMDNTGFFPTAINAGDTETCKNWAFGLPEYLKDPDYTDAPNNDDLSSSENQDVSTMWMYHAVGQTILAANILRADARVDQTKVGITGISWGGLITSITIGYDNRFAFAVPVYCTGYAKENIWGNMFTRYTRDNGTAELWSAEQRFKNATMPVLWLCWNDDGGFYVKSNSLSYLDGVKNNPDTRLSMKHLMFHSHACAWVCPETMAFADSVVKGGAKLTEVINNSRSKNIDITLNPDPSADSLTATVFYLTKIPTHSRFKKYHYDPWCDFLDEYWNSIPVDIKNNKITATAPDVAIGYYVEIKSLTNGIELVTNSTYTDIQ